MTDQRYTQPLTSTPIAQVPDRALPAPGTDGLTVKVARDFGPSGFDYTYGESWKNEVNVLAATVAGVACITIKATEHGGGGVVLGGIPLTPHGQTHLVVTLASLAGNQAQGLTFNISRTGAEQRSVTCDISHLKLDQFVNIVVPLPGVAADYAAVEQIQIQGTNWSGSASVVHLALDRIGTTTP